MWDIILLSGDILEFKLIAPMSGIHRANMKGSPYGRGDKDKLTDDAEDEITDWFKMRKKRKYCADAHAGGVNEENAWKYEPLELDFSLLNSQSALPFKQGRIFGLLRESSWRLLFVICSTGVCALDFEVG